MAKKKDSTKREVLYASHIYETQQFPPKFTFLAHRFRDRKYLPSELNRMELKELRFQSALMCQYNRRQEPQSVNDLPEVSRTTFDFSC